MSRHKAAALHITCSVAVALLVVAGMLFVWYPPPLFAALGAEGMVFIMVGVDVVLGPLVTWVIFSPTKRLSLLKLDLAIIAVLQLIALGYGVYVISEARPAYLLFVRDRFEVTSVDEIDPKEQAKATRPEFRSSPLLGPKLAAADIPTNPEEQLRVMMSGTAGADLKTFPQYYVPYETEVALVLKKGRPIAVLRKHHQDSKVELDRAIAKTGLPEDRLLFLPLRARKKDMSVLVDAKTGRIAGYAPLDPW
jgi:hypothetical protein